MPTKYWAREIADVQNALPIEADEHSIVKKGKTHKTLTTLLLLRRSL